MSKIGKAFFAVINVVLLVCAALAAHEGDYSRATFRLLCALFIHVVILKGEDG